VTIGEWRNRMARITGGLAGWARQFDLLTLVILFALGGHLLLAFLLDTASASGVDFAAIDPDHTRVAAAQIALFAIQVAFVVFALAKSGIKTGPTLAGVAALIWAASMLMLTIVTAQCDLFGACL